ncbi:MAG TPA: beta-lactamase family protein [Dehalococcoidia bacterium]|nr:beta-lactamase family protein [Dehalococcoidia bacterium]
MSRQNKNKYPLPSSSPEDAGFSSERLSRICPGLQKFIDRQMVPNLVTLVARHGKIVHHEAQGYMDFESKKLAGRDTIYRLWSNSKPITGTATMICVEDGLLSLDDPVSKYIPAFKNQVVRTELGRGALAGVPTVPVKRDITIRDCLRNTTGLATARRAPLSYLNEYKDALVKSGVLISPQRPSGTLREILEALAQLPLESQPGTRFEYQVGYPIVGLILEMVTGKSMEEFYQERIFRPLGMKDTSFYMTKEKLDRFPTLYRPILKAGEWKLEIDEKPENTPTLTGSMNYIDAGGGGGGVLSTAADYVRFAQMLLNGGELDGARILGRKTVELMTSSHTGDMVLQLTGPGFGFGMGVGVYKGSGEVPIMRSVGSYGWSGAAGTTYFADPKEDLICVCFSQVFMHLVMGDNTYQEEFERLVYQALL